MVIIIIIMIKKGLSADQIFKISPLPKIDPTVQICESTSWG